MRAAAAWRGAQRANARAARQQQGWAGVARTVVPQASVRADLLHPLEVLTVLHVEDVGHRLRVLAVLVVLLAVEHPVGHLELPRVLHNGHQPLHLLSRQLARPAQTRPRTRNTFSARCDRLRRGRLQPSSAPRGRAAAVWALQTAQAGVPIPARLAPPGQAQGSVCAPLVEVDLSLLARNVGKAAADTLDGGEREHHLHPAVKVGVEHTKNVLEIRLVHDE